MITTSSIISIEAIPLDLPLIESFSIATGHQEEVKNVLVVVRLSNGTIGLGEAAPFPAVSGETQKSSLNAIKSIRHHLLNKDIRNWKQISEEVKLLMGNEHAALCGVQMALADAVANFYNIPLAVLFGGASDSLTTDMTIIASDVEHAGRSAKAIVDRGIRTIKIKTQGKDIRLDFERVKKVKEIAPSALLTVDGNCGYSLEGAFDFVDLLHKENIPLLFFEQPFPRDNWKAMSEFTQKSGIKVAADESARSAADMLRIVEERAAHVVNIKLMKCGLWEAMRMVEIAKSAEMELMIGGMVETILAMTFSAHFAAGVGGFMYADLDTPLFIPAHPFTGGFKLSGDCIKIDLDTSGHGVSLKNM